MSEDLATLLQPRQGWLWKLGGGLDTGTKWNRRWFVLRENALVYLPTAKDFLGFRDKPSGMILLDECNVRVPDADDREKSLAMTSRQFSFVLAHASGESVVLAAETEREMQEWLQALRTARMCVPDVHSASQEEEARRPLANAQLDAVKPMDAENSLARIESELESAQCEHRQVDLEKESAEKKLKELMARFKLRKALLHWRHRKLTLSFRSLIQVVFHARTDTASRLEDGADHRLSAMDSEVGTASAARQDAEAALRSSDSMITRERTLKQEGEAELKELERMQPAEADRAAHATQRVSELQRSGAQRSLGVREKDEVLALMANLQQLTAEADQQQLQLQRRAYAKHRA